MPRICTVCGGDGIEVGCHACGLTGNPAPFSEGLLNNLAGDRRLLSQITVDEFRRMLREELNQQRQEK